MEEQVFTIASALVVAFSLARRCFDHSEARQGSRTKAVGVRFRLRDHKRDVVTFAVAEEIREVDPIVLRKDQLVDRDDETSVSERRHEGQFPGSGMDATAEVDPVNFPIDWALGIPVVILQADVHDSAPVFKDICEIWQRVVPVEQGYGAKGGPLSF